MLNEANVVIGTIQLALAATFAVAASIALRRGKRAQGAAETTLRKAGHEMAILKRSRIRFEESALESLLPYGIAAILITAAVLNLGGEAAGRVITWIFQPLLLILGGLVTFGQLIADRVIVKALVSEGVTHANAAAVALAARREFPGWLRPLILIRFLLTTLGSITIIVLLIAMSG